MRQKKPLRRQQGLPMFLGCSRKRKELKKTGEPGTVKLVVNKSGKDDLLTAALRLSRCKGPSWMVASKHDFTGRNFAIRNSCVHMLRWNAWYEISQQRRCENTASDRRKACNDDDGLSLLGRLLGFRFAPLQAY